MSVSKKQLEKDLYAFIRVLKKLNLAKGEKDLSFGTKWIRKQVKKAYESYQPE